MTGIPVVARLGRSWWPALKTGWAIVLMACAAPVPVQGQEALFQQGNARYQEGDYGGAAEAYEAVIEGGFESSELYYNLGNAYFRLDDLARSVLYYERALRLDRGNDDAAANLALVKERLPDRIDPLPRFWLLSLVDGWINLLPRQVLLSDRGNCLPGGGRRIGWAHSPAPTGLVGGAEAAGGCGSGLRGRVRRNPPAPGYAVRGAGGGRDHGVGSERPQCAIFRWRARPLFPPRRNQSTHRTGLRRLA